MKTKQILDATDFSVGSTYAGRAVKTASDGCINKSLLATYFFFNNTNNKFGFLQSIPQPPVTGDVWYEVGGDGTPLYGWPWIRDAGGFWRSPDFYLESTFLNISSTTWDYLSQYNGLNMYVRSLRVVSYATMPQSASNYWKISLNRRSAANATTEMGSFLTSTNSINTWTHQSVAINTQVVCGVNFTMLFDVQLTPNGIPGNLYASTRFVYNFARP